MILDGSSSIKSGGGGGGRGRHGHHRHSIPSHRLSNYLKFLHELASGGVQGASSARAAAAAVFSTAVISGSSSAPDLGKEMIVTQQGMPESEGEKRLRCK